MPETTADTAAGVAARDLSDEDLIRELGAVHRTRHDTLRHGSNQALAHHDERTVELEGEYLRRFPGREVSPARLTAGARDRAARAEAEQGPAAVERTVP